MIECNLKIVCTELLTLDAAAWGGNKILWTNNEWDAPTLRPVGTKGTLLVYRYKQRQNASQNYKMRLTQVRLQELASMLLKIGDRNHGSSRPQGLKGQVCNLDSCARKQQHIPTQKTQIIAAAATTTTTVRKGYGRKRTLLACTGKAHKSSTRQCIDFPRCYIKQLYIKQFHATSKTGPIDGREGPGISCAPCWIGNERVASDTTHEPRPLIGMRVAWVSIEMGWRPWPPSSPNAMLEGYLF